MSKLKMPKKGKSAAMMAELQAEHAAPATAPDAPPTVPDIRPPQDTDQPSPDEDGSHDLASREERLAAALERTEGDAIAVVTVRVPARLNGYMDEYVARMKWTNPRAKYRKQDAVAEAFAAFYADHPMPPIASQGEPRL